MGLFSFGGSKSKSKSQSNARSYVDPAQQRYLDDIRSRASMLNQGGMPVEGVAGINPALDAALGSQFRGGQMMAGAGAGLIGQGSGLTRGSAAALGMSDRMMNQRFRPGRTGKGLSKGANQIAAGAQGAQAYTGSGLNFDTMQGLANAGATMGFAQQNGINTGMAQGIAGMADRTNAAQADTALQTGLNTGLVNQIGNMATMANAAQARGIDTDTAAQAQNMATLTDAAQNIGFTQQNLGNYINNDVLNSQIDAASRDVQRNLFENQLTGNASAAAASGNSGSSRRAVMDAIAARGAADRVADISANMRGQAYNQAVGVEANRASQNAGLQQQTNMANQGAVNNLASLGLNIAQSQSAQNVGNLQQTNLANQSAANTMQSQGVGVAANQAAANQSALNQTALANMGARNQANMANQGAYNQLLGQGVSVAANQASQNAANQQQSMANNQAAFNQLLGQGAGIGASQLESNLGRLTNNSQFNAGQFNNLYGQGANLMQQMYGLNQNNNQFGATLASQLGAQGVSNMQAGANMMGSALDRQQASGDFLRNYQQQLLTNQYQQAMAPYNALNFYNQIVGAPTVLNEASSSSKGKSGSVNFGFG